MLCRHLSIILFFIAIATGCDQGFTISNLGSENALEQSEGLTASEQAGKEKFQAMCSQCHSTIGDGAKFGTSSILASLNDSATAVTATSNRMPISNPSLCNLECANEVISWVAKVNNISFASNLPTRSAGYELVIEDNEDTFRRASLLLGSGIPSQEQLSSVKGASEDELKASLVALMVGDGFKEFLKNGANDQLLVRSVSIGQIRFSLANWYKDYDLNFKDNDERRAVLDNEIREQPLELINYIVQSNKPYTEILTADYAFASQQLALLFKSNTIPAAGEWIEIAHNGQYTSGGNGRASKNWSSASPTTIPQAGILTTMAYLTQNPSTATNRNRARSRWTMDHFLGYNIEASAPRVKIEDATDDNNPTLNNPACVVCHETMDPIAAAFRDHGNNFLYLDGDFGQHALSDDYVKSDLFESGQKWYADVLPAGFNGKRMPDNVDALPWLASEITNDLRFAQSVVKFWWPAIFGVELYDTTSPEELARQQNFVNAIANKFKSSGWDLKVLLVELLMSDWYRAENLKSVGEVTEGQPITYSSQRLLTPEEIAQKQEHFFGNSGQYMDKHFLAFGGIDSNETTLRDRNINVVKMNVVKANVLVDACAATFEEFDLPINQRTLFTEVELDTLPGLALSAESKTVSMGTKTTQYIASIQAGYDYQLNISSAKGDVRLRKLKIVSPSGIVIFNGHVRLLDSSNNLSILSDNSEKPDEDIRFRNANRSISLGLNGAILETGAYMIETTHLSHISGNDTSLSVTIESSAKPQLITDQNSKKIKTQIVKLFERMMGESYSADHIEIQLAYELFLELRNNAISRAEKNLIGSSYLCVNVSNVANYDKHYTFSAWKGLLIAFATDFNFITE